MRVCRLRVTDVTVCSASQEAAATFLRCKSGVTVFVRDNGKFVPHCTFKLGVVNLAVHEARIGRASSVGSENLKGRTGRRIWEHNIKTDTKLTTYDNRASCGPL
jgi:hypothetical protein